MVRQIYVFIFAVLVVILGACGIVSYLSRKPIGKYVGFLCLALIPPVLGNMIIVSSTTEGRALVGCYAGYLQTGRINILIFLFQLIFRLRISI